MSYLSSSHARVMPLPPPAATGSAHDEFAAAASGSPGSASSAALSLIALTRQASGIIPSTAKEVRLQLERHAQDVEAKLLVELQEIRNIRSEMRRAVRRGSRSTDPLLGPAAAPAAPNTGTPRAMRSSLPLAGSVSFNVQASSGLGAGSTNELYTALAPNSSHNRGAVHKSSSLRDTHRRVSLQPATNAASPRSPRRDSLLYPVPSGRPGYSNRPLRPSRLSQTSTRCSLMSELDARQSMQNAGSQAAAIDPGSAPAFTGKGPVERVNRGAGGDAGGGLSKRPCLLQRFSSFLSSAFKGGKKKPTPLLPRRRVLSIVNAEAALADTRLH